MATPSGNSREAALTKLKKKRPDLYEQVILGSMSAHSAMIEAGYRTKSITIPMDVERAARTLKNNFDDERLRSLVELIEKSVYEAEEYLSEEDIVKKGVLKKLLDGCID